MFWPTVGALAFAYLSLANIYNILPITGYNWASLADLDSPPDLCSGPSECVNGGICFPLLDTTTASTSCTCPPGYTGTSCSSPSTTCAESPCLNSGNCTDLEDAAGNISQYVCDCENTGYSGTYCHIEDNSCVGNKCSNGGTCLGKSLLAYGYIISP